MNTHEKDQQIVSVRGPGEGQQLYCTVFDLVFWWLGYLLEYQAESQKDASSTPSRMKGSPAINTLCYLLGSAVLGWAWVLSFKACRFWLLSLRQLIFQMNISRSGYVLHSEQFISLAPIEFCFIWDHSALLQIRPQNANSDTQKLGA